MSLVLVQPSTRSSWNEPSTAPVSAVWSARGSTAASVVRTASIVAIAGESIAAPLAIPPIVAVTPRDLDVRDRLLAHRVGGQDRVGGRVPPSAPAASAATSFGIPSSIGVHRQRDPDETGRAHEHVARRDPETGRGQLAHPRARRRGPASPVAALALPELSTTAAARPSRRWSRLTSTGAAGARLVVNTPAAVAGTWSAVRDDREVGLARLLDARRRARPRRIPAAAVTLTDALTASPRPRTAPVVSGSPSSRLAHWIA